MVNGVNEITPVQAQEILKENGLDLTLEEIAKLLHLLNKLANLALEVDMEDENC